MNKIISYEERLELIYTAMVNDKFDDMNQQTKDLITYGYYHLRVFENARVNPIFANVIDRWWDKYNVVTAAPAEHLYVVNASPRIARHKLNEIDQQCYDTITAPYRVMASHEDQALDDYHHNVPIKVLDDWDITCDVIATPETKGPAYPPMGEAPDDCPKKDEEDARKSRVHLDNAMHKFKDAALALNEAMSEFIPNHELNDHITPEYPFNDSFDELVLKIIDWADDTGNNLFSK